MKNLIILILIFNLISCVSKKQPIKIEKNNSIELNEDNSLTKDEYDLVNDLLDFEFTSKRYESYINLEKVLIDKAGNHYGSIAGYEPAYKEMTEITKNNRKISGQFSKTRWTFDSLQFAQIKYELKKEKSYTWKPKDIKNYKVTISNYEELQNSIKNSTYVGNPKKLVFFISRPYIFNENYGFIFFHSGGTSTGFTTNDRFYVLMKKENGKWIKDGYYDDGFMW